jgi:hypothetical protein
VDRALIAPPGGGGGNNAANDGASVPGDNPAASFGANGRPRKRRNVSSDEPDDNDEVGAAFTDEVAEDGLEEG